MESSTASTASDEQARLRDTLLDQLVANGTVSSRAIEEALRTTPRHLFVPRASLEQAYADDVVITKHGADGAPISAASQPTVVATMLEQLQAQPGQSVLEIGAGTGYNAALLAGLVGDRGSVVTVDVDGDIVDGARRNLTATGHTRVEVVLGDGAQGHRAGAPYDRVIATVGAWDLPIAWIQQLAPAGRLVVPLRLRGSIARSIVFERAGDTVRSVDSDMSAFMPLRNGIADDPRRFAPLTADGSVSLQLTQEQPIDGLQLTGILDSPAHEAWTDVTMAGDESFEWLDLWLTCTLPGALSRMTVSTDARESELVRPQFGWGAMATSSDGSLAYLTLRRIEAPGGSRFEVGVIGHGTAGAALRDQVVDQIRTWDQHFRRRDVEFAVAPRGGPELAGQFVFAEPTTTLAISWV